jgi:hypothetical protein
MVCNRPLNLVMSNRSVRAEPATAARSFASGRN